jgi:rhodanese-related sulfurtransferase
MRIKIFFIIALLLTSAAAWAQNYNFPNLTADDVAKHIVQSEKLLVVDARTEEEYRQGHIPNAVNIPPSQFKAIGNHLPQNKSLPIIFYCRGYSWGLTMEAAVAAQAQGYTNIFTFRGGFPEWISRDYPIAKPWGIMSDFKETR